MSNQTDAGGERDREVHHVVCGALLQAQHVVGKNHPDHAKHHWPQNLTELRAVKGWTPSRNRQWRTAQSCKMQGAPASFMTRWINPVQEFTPSPSYTNGVESCRETSHITETEGRINHTETLTSLSFKVSPMMSRCVLAPNKICLRKGDALLQALRLTQARNNFNALESVGG